MKRIISIVWAIILVLTLNSCASAQEFNVATDLIDQTTWTEENYTFQLRILYGDEVITPEVTCNGILLTEENGKYTASLWEGDNVIEIVAVYQQQRECRTYTIKRLKQDALQYQTDLTDGATVAAGRYRFRVTATKSGEACKTEVFCNQTPVTAEDGDYTAYLTIGENVITVIVYDGDNKIEKNYTIHRAEELYIDGDLSDGMLTPDRAFSFTAKVFYGDTQCDAQVVCNGILLTEKDGRYDVKLHDGENTIEISARYGADSVSRRYTVICRAEFKITSDVETAAIRNDKLTFRVQAAFNNEACAFAITHNGAAVSGENGTYTVELATGKNVFVATARSGDHVQTKTWTVSYEGFKLITDLESFDTGKVDYEFRASAHYGKTPCSTTVTVNGKKLEPVGAKYTLKLAAGENEIRIVAGSGNAEKEYTYLVRYINEPPTLSVGITDNKTYKSSVYSFDLVAKDGLGKKMSGSQISFYIDWNAGDNKENFVATSDVAMVWDDSTMTSFRINFKKGQFASHAGTPFLLKIVATDNVGRTAQKIVTLTYTPVGAGEKIGEVVFSMEGFSIGCGYFIEPMWVPVYEGVPFSETLLQILEDHGLRYTYTGSVNSGFYLASVLGLNIEGNRIADGVWDFVKDRGYVRSIADKGSLGEFDYGSGSGWMYSVNGVYKNYGFADYYPQDGDAVRVQFTVILGEDLGGGGALGGGSSGSLLGDNPDYAPIMKMLADIAQSDADKTVYHQAVTAITQWDLSQKVMNEQIQKLKKTYG